MAGNFPPLVIFFDISEKRQVQLGKVLVLDAEQNSPEVRQEIST
jgi:hypothetical protein